MKTLERKPRSLTAIVDREMKRVGLAKATVDDAVAFLYAKSKGGKIDRQDFREAIRKFDLDEEEAVSLREYVRSEWGFKTGFSSKRQSRRLADINKLYDEARKLWKQSVPADQIMKKLQEKYGNIPTRELLKLLDDLEGHSGGFDSELSSLCSRELRRQGVQLVKDA